MKLKNLSLKHKKLIIAGIAIIAIVVTVLIIFLKRPETTEQIAEYSVPEHAIDSVLAKLSDTEKAGLLLFACAEIKDSSDFQNLLMLSAIHGISSWQVSAVSHDYHKPVSDSLLAICTAPGTYAVRWNDETPDAGRLPDLNTLLSVSDTAFLNYLSHTCSNMFATYGINSMFIPAFFNENTSHIPHIRIINRLVLLIERIYNANSFCPSMLVFEQSEVLVRHGDTIVQFPNNDLLGLFNQKSNFSFYTNIRVNAESSGLLIYGYEKGTDIKDFVLSNHDMLLVEADEIEHVFNELSGFFKSNKYKEQLEKKLKRIISAKLLAVNFHENREQETILTGTTSWSTFLMKISENTSCLVKNENIFPFVNMKAHYIVADGFHIPEFHHYMKQSHAGYAYTMIEPNAESVIKSISNIKPDQTPIVFIQGNSGRFQFPFSENDSLIDGKKLVLVDFSHSGDTTGFQYFDAILIINGTDDWYQKTAVNVITGGTNVFGQNFTDPSGKNATQSLEFNLIRLKYSYPEDAQLDGAFLHSTIDSICLDGIIKGAFPGCQVFAAKDGKIVFNKAYGHHSYGKTSSVQTSDLYDVASVTKIAATTIAAMKMCEQGKLSLNETMFKYFKNTEINYTRIKPDTVVIIDTLNLNKVDLKKLIQQGKIPKDTFRIRDTLMVTIDTVFSKATPSLNIFKVPIRYMLMHYSGIVPTLPILPFIQLRKYHLIDLGLNSDDYEAQNINWKEVWNIRFSERRSDSSKVQIADNFYMKDRWLDSLWSRTKEVGVSGRKYSQYTCLNMILIQQAIDTINRINMDRYMQREFYGPLGLRNIMYKPLDHRVPRGRIAPTENDRGWRRQVIHGHVHDPSAAMLGGISGNAGLFSSAEDLGVLFQMVLNWGTYGGRRYLSENIIRTFIKTNEETGRGLGFDKYSPKNIVAPSASKNTYGHTGFTGCCVWVDPDYQLVFVFLSNRVHPNVNNWRLNSLKIRQKVHQVFYDADLSKRNHENNTR